MKSIDEFASHFNVDYEIKETSDLVSSKDITKISDNIASAARSMSAKLLLCQRTKKVLFESFLEISDRVARKADCDVILVETPRIGNEHPKTNKEDNDPYPKRQIQPSSSYPCICFNKICLNTTLLVDSCKSS